MIARFWRRSQTSAWVDTILLYVTVDSRCHRRPAAPALGAPLDVGEEEGDGAAGQVRHHPLQTLGGTWCCPIVACEYRGHARDSPTHHSNDPGIRQDSHRIVTP